MSSRTDKINKAKGIVTAQHVSWDTSRALRMSKNSKHSYAIGGSMESHEAGERFEENLEMYRDEM